MIPTIFLNEVSIYDMDFEEEYFQKKKNEIFKARTLKLGKPGFLLRRKK